jgi:hypothetical protein
MNPYESFYHSLVASKLWLCENLEIILDREAVRDPVVNILASWDSLLAFMMAVRRPKSYEAFNTYDIDSESVGRANMICDHWNYEYPKMTHNVRDIRTLDFSNSIKDTIFINCSIDQVDGVDWYDLIPIGSLVCLQCTNLQPTHEIWKITQGYTLHEFSEAYKISNILFSGTKTFDYGHLQFDRHMLIGIK